MLNYGKEPKERQRAEPLAGKRGKAKAKAKAPPLADKVQPLAGQATVKRRCRRCGLGTESVISRVAFSPFVMIILITSGKEL